MTACSCSLKTGEVLNNNSCAQMYLPLARTGHGFLQQLTCLRIELGHFNSDVECPASRHSPTFTHTHTHHTHNADRQTDTHTHTRTNTRQIKKKQMYVCVYVCVCVCIYIYINIHTFTYVRTYVCKHVFLPLVYTHILFVSHPRPPLHTTLQTASMVHTVDGINPALPIVTNRS